MAKVYHLRTMPAWNTWRTMAGFFITSALLGHLVMTNFLDGARLAWGIVVVLLAAELGLILSAKRKAEESANRLRVGLIVTAIIATGIMFIVPNLTSVWVSLPIFLMVLVEEIIGRKLFYASLQERVL
jgi:DMSO reductase anchor subunit